MTPNAEPILTNAPLHNRIAAAPVVHDGERAHRVLGDLARRCTDEPALALLGGLLRQPAVNDLLAGIFGVSPYLTALIERDPAGLMQTLATAPEERFAALCHDLGSTFDSTDALADAMRHLRLFKNDIALLTALCDLGGIWPVMSVTRRLSEAADAAVGAAVRFLFRQAARRRAIGGPTRPTATSCSPWASTAPSSSTTPPTSI